MKKILIITLLTTFSFSQTEEWIYFNSVEEAEYFVNRIKPDGSENEVIVDGVWMLDMSLDKSKIVSFANHTITIVDIETMETQSVFFPEYGLSPKDIHFAYDENIVIFSDNGNELYKYSFIDSSFTLIVPDMGGIIDIRDITMSPDKQKAAFLAYDLHLEADSIDVMVADIQTGEVSILGTFPSLGHDCFIDYFGYDTYWGADDYIYFTICETSLVQQLLKIHSSNGEPAQLIENEIMYTLSSDDSYLEKLVYLKFINDSLEYWMIDLESNETSYLDIDGEIVGYLLSQAWSPDKSKVAITSWYSGLNVYDTITDSMITIVDAAWAPMFWVGESEVSIVEPSDNMPTQLSIEQNYPNPFNPTTTIRILVESRHAVTLNVYDINGRVVDKLVQEVLSPGQHEIQWNASNQPSGIYFAELVSGDFRQVQKMVLVK